MSNMIGRVDRTVSESPLGLQSTIIVILVVFFSTFFFLGTALRWTLRKSEGAQGKLALCCAVCARQRVAHTQAQVRRRTVDAETRPRSGTR